MTRHCFHAQRNERQCPPDVIRVPFLYMDEKEYVDTSFFIETRVEFLIEGKSKKIMSETCKNTNGELFWWFTKKRLGPIAYSFTICVNNLYT